MSCAICFERFKGSDNNLYSTTCGHIYHFVCMQQWKSRSTSCPQCRAYNPKTHKIYLELNDEEPNASLLEDQLRDCRTKIKQLELELKNGSNKFSSGGNTIKCQMLEETLESTLEHNETLEKKLKEAELKIIYLQRQCSANDKQITLLNTSLNRLTGENNNLERNYKNLQVEYNRLKKLNDSPNTRWSTYIAEMVQSSSLKIIGAQINPGTNLTNFILYLGHKMDVHYVRSDIIRTAFLKDEQTLLVQFREIDLRETFYENEYKLRYYNETERIQFFQLNKDEFTYNTIFDYALNLKMFNYKSVFRQNKKVMARKDDYDDAIRVYSKEHVEELIEEESLSESSSYYSIF